MTTAELRALIVAGLKAEGYRLVMDGPTGEYSLDCRASRWPRDRSRDLGRLAV